MKPRDPRAGRAGRAGRAPSPDAPPSVAEPRIEDPAAALERADRLASAGDRAAARDALEKLLESDVPTTGAAALRLARLDEEEGLADDAARRWQQVLAYDVEHGEAWAGLRRLEGPGPAAESAPAALTAAATLDVGAQVTLRRYRILRELGRGAFATVYLARDEHLGRQLALKIVHPSPSASTARRRLFAEARAVARLRHPGVVALYDVDEAAGLIAMEHVAGGTLRERLRSEAGRRGARGLDAREVWGVADGMLRALDYVHARALVHGDLSPRNVLLRRPGAPVLVDFAGRARGEAEADAQPGGTPLYLAPELFRGALPSAATDLFAAGAILWEALVGEPMRDAGDVRRDRLVSRLLPREARARAGREHAALADLVDALVAAAPGERPANARAALARLGA